MAIVRCVNDRGTRAKGKRDVLIQCDAGVETRKSMRKTREQRAEAQSMCEQRRSQVWMASQIVR